MNIHHTTRLLAAMAGLALAAAWGSVAYAQTESKSPSRAEVKEQTKAANKAGQIATGEEDSMKSQMPATKSTKSREERKAETKAANKGGGLGSTGQTTYKTYNESQRKELAKSTKTRAEGKAETKQAIKDKQMMPAGEGSEPAKK
ncbi:MAG TPA: hypothetical protein VFU71_08300 [Burkholderiaceae bacterium]|nr:hypothetical protein [Burkholderiaceae bacterium]